MRFLDRLPIGIRWKLLVTILLLLLLVLAAFALLAFYQFSTTVTELETSKLSSDALAIAVAAAAEMDSDLVGRLRSNGIEGNGDWNSLYSELATLDQSYSARGFSLTFFVYVPTTRPGEIEYLIDTWESEHRARLGDRTTLDASDVRLVGFQEAAVERDIVFDENGQAFALAVAPIQAPNGSVIGALGVEVGAARLVDVLDRVGRSLTITFVLAIPLAVIFAFVISGGIVDPLHRLSDAALVIADSKRHYDSAMLATIMGRQDELGEAARRFHEMALSVEHREQRLHTVMDQLRMEMGETRVRLPIRHVTDAQGRKLAHPAYRPRKRYRTTQHFTGARLAVRMEDQELIGTDNPPETIKLSSKDEPETKQLPPPTETNPL